MDTPQIIILSTIVNLVLNGLIAGIIIYVIQKKIDATIQKSVIDHQVRFEINYPKTLETMTNIKEKFSLFVRTCNRMIATKDMNQKDVVFRNLVEFYEYSMANSMYVSENVEKEITKIFQDSVELMGKAIGAFDNPDRGNVLIKYLNEINDQEVAVVKLYRSVAQDKE